MATAEKRARRPRAGAPNGIDLARIDGWVFDLDGTLILTDKSHKGYEPLPGAAELLAALRTAGKRFVILTNGSFTTPSEYLPTLNGIGLDVREGEMMTPTSVAAEHLVRVGVRRLLVLGNRGVWHPLAEAGIDIVRPKEARSVDGVDAVYIGWDPDFDIEAYKLVCEAIWAGAKPYVSSKAPFFVTRGGRTVGISAAIAAAAKATTGRTATLLGKPSVHAMRSVARTLGLPAERIAVVGDDPRIEPMMARAGGAIGIGVETGLAKAADFAAVRAERRAQLVVRDAAELLALLREAM